MVNFNKVCMTVASAVLEYDTNKIVHIKSKKVGLINRIIQLVIIAYIIGYVIIYQKGYQSSNIGLSSVTTKLKGTALTNLSLDFPINATMNSTLYDGPRIWDSSDYVIPAEENDAVFVMTNMQITPRQEQGKCPEDGQLKQARCHNDSECVAGQEVKVGHGVMTGKCVPPDRPSLPPGMKYNVCEIYSWCPVEFDKLPMPGTNFGKPLRNDTCLLQEAVNFTILIKNTVQFSTYGVSRRNINDKQNKTYLQGCNYNSGTHKLCPIFKLKTIFGEISDTGFEDAAIYGGVVAIKIKWDCNFDYAEDECQPEYSFGRVDNPRADIARGYNFRVSSYDVENNVQYRTLIKAFGIRFVILVDAKAGKFDIIPLLRNLGAGLALLSVATVMCDICVLYLLKKKYFYRTKKYQYVDDPDASSSENESSIQDLPEDQHDDKNNAGRMTASKKPPSGTNYGAFENESPYENE